MTEFGSKPACATLWVKAAAQQGYRKGSGGGSDERATAC
jgi:hypothetical protein